MDRNRLSITGTPNGNIWVNDALVFTPSGIADSAVVVRDRFGIQSKISGEMRELHIPSVVAHAGDSDAVKLSGCVRLRLIIGTIDGRAAAEDAIDINNRCAQVEALIGQLWPGQTYCGTIKGASRGIHLSVLKQHGHGRATDWDYGNFSDQGNDPTTACTLEVETADQSPVKVRLLSADPVQYLNPEVQQYDTSRLNGGWFYPLYNLLKDLLAFLHIKI